jgi:hypothetical protein
MRFAKWVFLLAGVSGILLAVPPYFLLFEPATTLNTGDVRNGGNDRAGHGRHHGHQDDQEGRSVGSP